MRYIDFEQLRPGHRTRAFAGSPTDDTWVVVRVVEVVQGIAAASIAIWLCVDGACQGQLAYTTSEAAPSPVEDGPAMELPEDLAAFVRRSADFFAEAQGIYLMKLGAAVLDKRRLARPRARCGRGRRNGKGR